MPSSTRNLYAGAVDAYLETGDIMERNLYNSILSGMNLSGYGWSYTNPLRWYGPEHELMTGDFHQRIDPGERRICCPTNLLRTVASMRGPLVYCLESTDLPMHRGVVLLKPGRHMATCR